MTPSMTLSADRRPLIRRLIRMAARPSLRGLAYPSERRPRLGGRSCGANAAPEIGNRQLPEAFWSLDIPPAIRCGPRGAAVRPPSAEVMGKLEELNRLGRASCRERGKI